ncbi:PAS domain-containing sensor histidine kinase [Pedobacter antarcticus]|nr:PAS domain S-box protein [Pedobacter antarcticus]SDL45606.1 PAS domain S-box-containing protein [Pedobacter antarcticus]SFE39049.1 PAS domain S-box-containing protein [Pedobacter antarcticus]
MNKKNSNNKGSLLSQVRERIESTAVPVAGVKEGITDQELAELLGELEIFQLELEMQNDELSESYQLLESERAKFAGLFNLAPVGYFILDHIGIIEEANQTGSDLLGQVKTNLREKLFQSYISPNHWELFYSFLHKLQTTLTKQSSEIVMLIPGGKELYTRMEGISVFDTFTRKNKFYVTLIDITESRSAQQKLMDTTHRLEMTLRASGTGTWTMELGNNKLFLDSFSYSILELNVWDFDGTIQSLLDLIHPDDHAVVRRSIINTINVAEDLDLEFRVMTSSGKTKNISLKGHQINREVYTAYFAGIIVDITERKRIAKISEDLKIERQKLIMSATIDAQEKERSQISSALHDSVCQILYGIRLNLQNVQLTKNLKNDFDKINQLLDQAIQETRDLSYELTPSVLRDFGFKAGIREMAKRLSTPKFTINTNIHSSADNMTPEVQLYIFRIIQELVSNSIKHASASLSEITVSQGDDLYTIFVRDNGIGFNQDIESALSLGSGIRGIKNRIFLLNGNMDLQTSLKGTAISIQFRVDAYLS